MNSKRAANQNNDAFLELATIIGGMDRKWAESKTDLGDMRSGVFGSNSESAQKLVISQDMWARATRRVVNEKRRPNGESNKSSNWWCGALSNVHKAFRLVVGRARGERAVKNVRLDLSFCGEGQKSIGKMCMFVGNFWKLKIRFVVLWGFQWAGTDVLGR